MLCSIVIHLWSLSNDTRTLECDRGALCANLQGVLKSWTSWPGIRLPPLLMPATPRELVQSPGNAPGEREQDWNIHVAEKYVLWSSERDILQDVVFTLCCCVEQLKVSVSYTFLKLNLWGNTRDIMYKRYFRDQWAQLSFFFIPVCLLKCHSADGCFIYWCLHHHHISYLSHTGNAALFVCLQWR